MKKVKLMYIHTYNYGNLMMAINFIKYALLGTEEQIDIYTDVIAKEELDRLTESLNCNENFNIYSDNLVISKKRNIVEKVINKIKFSLGYWSGIIKNRSKYDYIVYLGGDCLSEYYSKKQFIKDGLKIYLTSLKKPVLIVGQTIGPFTSYRKWLTKIFLGKSIVSTRDDVCYEYLTSEIGLKNIIKSRDLAFLPLPIEHNNALTEELLKKYGVETEKYITIVPSGLYKSYTNERDVYLKEYVKIFETLNINEKLNGLKFVVLPHVVNRNDDDRYIIRDIQKELAGKFDDRIMFIDDILLAHEARAILGNGVFTITGRMHAAVSTFEMKKPAISLSYSVKYKGVIGEGLEMNELVIDTKGNEVWAEGKIHEMVDEKVNYVIDYKEEVVKKIENKVDNCGDIAKNQIEECRKIIFSKENIKSYE